MFNAKKYLLTNGKMHFVKKQNKTKRARRKTKHLLLEELKSLAASLLFIVFKNSYGNELEAGWKSLWPAGGAI